jgi:hypothetical protein
LLDATVCFLFECDCNICVRRQTDLLAFDLSNQGG